LLPNRRRRIVLDVAHPPSDLLVLRVASHIPEGACVLVVKCNKCRDPSYSLIAKVALSRPDKAQGDSLAAIVLMNSKSIDVPAPAVPASNDHPDDLFASLGYEQGSWSAQDEAFNVLSAIGRARVLATSKRPKN
jgi:hypothetical protein